jgi:hypothetical protein
VKLARTRSAVMCFIITVGASGRAAGQTELRGEAIRIVRLSTAPASDGRIDQGEWSEATRVETWFETQPGDNVPPPMRNVGYIGYDDKFFYALGPRPDQPLRHRLWRPDPRHAQRRP